MVHFIVRVSRRTRVLGTVDPDGLGVVRVCRRGCGGVVAAEDHDELQVAAYHVAPVDQRQGELVGVVVALGGGGEPLHGEHVERALLLQAVHDALQRGEVGQGHRRRPDLRRDAVPQRVDPAPLLAARVGDPVVAVREGGVEPLQLRKG